MKGRVSDGASWTWSALRPNPVCGFSTGSFMNLVVSLGVYAAICKELGAAFRCDWGLLAVVALLVGNTA